MSTVAVAYEALFLLLGVLLLWRIRRCTDRRERPSPAACSGDIDGSVAVSVIIPARDEERVLPQLLRSLGSQTMAPGEVLVVDDGSEDATAEVAVSLGARLVEAPPKPEGWVGKSWACWTGAQRANGTVLVFLDADVCLSPTGIADLCAAHRRDGGLVTVQPYHVVRRCYERLSAIFNIVVMMGVDCFGVFQGRVMPAGAFGPCMVMARDEYFAVDGHRAVHSEVVEDVAFGRLCASAGYPVRCYGGRGSVAFRMYSAGIRQLVQGWTKSMASGAGAIRPLTMVAIVLWLCGCTGAFSHLCIGVVRLARTGAWAYLVPAAAAYGLYAVQLLWMLVRIGRFGAGTALLYFLPLLFFHLTFVRSVVFTHVLRRVRWRGRTIRT